MIPFTRREMSKAWREARRIATTSPRQDPHRLLLFYSAECGLKAVLMKRRNTEVFTDEAARGHLHNLNSLLSELRASATFFLPLQLSLPSLKEAGGRATTRKCDIGALNQVWRYGARLEPDVNADLETKLDEINKWIEKELG